MPLIKFNNRLLTGNLIQPGGLTKLLFGQTHHEGHGCTQLRKLLSIYHTKEGTTTLP